MKRFLIIISAVVLVAFSSCTKITEGTIIPKDFGNPGNYTALEISNAFEAYVSENANTITITAGENVMPYIVVETVNNTLKIYLKPVAIVNLSQLKVVLPYNINLSAVNLSGAAEFHSEYGLIGEALKVELSGASKFESALITDELDLKMSGASKIVKKITESQYAVLCELCKGTISGASEAYIHCDGNINVNLSGASVLHFTGNAFTADSEVSGGSQIIHDVL